MIKIFENLDINDLNGEIWKTIDDFPDYQVSNLSRVKSLYRHNGTDHRILKQHKNKDGYFQVILYKNKKPKTKLVHRLIYETFKEKLEKDYVIHHTNDEKDNFIDNLKSIPKEEHDNNKSEKTRKRMSESMKGKYKSEEHKKRMSESHGLSYQTYINIENSVKEKILTEKEMIEKYKVSRSTIQKIKRKIIQSN
jgi:hypothetical protein